MKRGQPISSGTVITLVDSRDGKLFRYVVMEKRTGWGAGYPPDTRNGEWEYQAFNVELLLVPQVAGAAGLRVDVRSNEECEVGRHAMATWARDELRKIEALMS